jgi:hypothetical protein
MEQICVSEMQPFYDGTLIRQLYIAVHHALALKCNPQHSVLFLLCFFALCLTNLIYFNVAELRS